MPLSPGVFRKTPLQILLIVPFVIQTVGAVAVVGYLSYRNGQKAVNDVATQLRNETSDRIKQNLTYLVAIPFQSFETYDAALSQNRIALNNRRDVEKFLWRQLPAFPHIAATAFVTANQEFFAGERQDDGEIVIRASEVENNHTLTTYTTNPEGERREIINAGKPNFDPRKRPYYKIPVQQKRAFWGKVFPHITGNFLYIAAGKPIYTQTGDLQGVWMTSLNLVMFGDFLSKLKIGKTGQSFILERSGEMIATSTGEKPFQYYPDKVVQVPEQKVERLKVANSSNAITQKTSQALLEQFHDFQNIQASHQLKFTVDGKNYFVQVDPFRDSKGIDWLVVVTIPEEDFMNQINANTRNTILLCLAALGLALAVGILTARAITNPVLRLTQCSKELAAGNLNKRVETKDLIEIEEIDILEHSFNSMAGQLKESFETLEDKVKERTAELASANDEIIALNERLKEDNLRMGAELDIVRQMQQMILPNAEELEIDGLDIAGYMDAADEVGGDYYDVLNTDGVVTLGIGDVTGHGLESGILMLMAQTAVRTLKEIRETDPVRFLDALNRTLYKNVQRMNSEKSLTLAILNYSEGRVSISGQHEETIIVRLGGEIERIDTMDLGFPIALHDDIAEFISHISIELQLGDGIVLYTDGIPEAKDINKKQYGVEQMCEVISQNWHLSAQEIKQAVIDDLRRHIGTQKVFDDITLLVLKRTELGVETESQPQAVALV
jgi:serine phosphatase RsbU (regulator of sigma subunit)